MSFFLNPALACDYYKVGHPFMQPSGMETVYATWTARGFKHHKDCPKTAVFGHQYTIKEWFIDFCAATSLCAVIPIFMFVVEGGKTE